METTILVVIMCIVIAVLVLLAVILWCLKREQTTQPSVKGEIRVKISAEGKYYFVRIKNIAKNSVTWDEFTSTAALFSVIHVSEEQYHFKRQKNEYQSIKNYTDNDVLKNLLKEIEESDTSENKEDYTDKLMAFAEVYEEIDSKARDDTVVFYV